MEGIWQNWDLLRQVTEMIQTSDLWAQILQLYTQSPLCSQLSALASVWVSTWGCSIFSQTHQCFWTPSRVFLLSLSYCSLYVTVRSLSSSSGRDHSYNHDTKVLGCLPLYFGHVAYFSLWELLSQCNYYFFWGSFYFSLCARFGVYVMMHAFLCRCQRPEVSDPLELKLQMFVSHPT